MAAFGESNFLQALGWAVLNSLWQMALLWVAYQFVTGVFKVKNPGKKSVLASSLLMTGFGWFVFTFASIFFSNDTTVAANLVSMDGNQQLNDWFRKTLPVASLIYLVLLVLPLVHFIRNYRYVQAIRHHGISKADVEWRMFVRRVAAQLGIQKPVHVWISEMVTSPVTIGYIKPVILIPMAAVNHLSTKQMEAVLLHELSHIRRYDYLVNLIIKFIQSILYFNPFVKAFVQIVEREREKSCDEMVMQFQYDPHGYATALLELEKANHLPKILAVAAAGKKNDLLHRIEWIMGVQKKKPVISFNKIAAVFAGLLFIISLNALLIFSKPSDNKQAPLFADLSSPFYFFVNDNDRKAADFIDPLPELNKEVIANIAAEKKEAAKQKIATDKQPIVPAEHISLFDQDESAPVINVTTFKPVIPVLSPKESAQVKEALNVSKIVLKEGQWRAVEQKIAEVFTEQEKTVLKAELAKQINKMDFSKWEQSLKIAYDKIDWNKVNANLDLAVSRITLDSLQRVYTKALTELNSLQVQLTENCQHSIPDTDVTVESLEQQKQNLQKAINKLRVVRTKKVIHL
ncbi:MAG TPA: M56 family metallopeptidase [Chitinophagaceae bacterium]